MPSLFGLPWFGRKRSDDAAAGSGTFPGSNGDTGPSALRSMQHLRDARVDLDSQILVDGLVDLPPDRDGLFPRAAHDTLRLDAKTTLMRLAVARASRDPASGFLRSEETGPAVYLPPPIATVIHRALCFSPPEPVHLRLGGEAGSLQSGPSIDGSKKQPLSDWLLELEETDDGLSIRLSAALKATRPIKDWLKDTGNFWDPVDGEPARLGVEFRVDRVTRAAAFAAYFPELAGTPLGEAEPGTTSLRDLRLDQALIGPHTMFGTTSRGQWASFYQGEGWTPSIAITPMGPERRTTTGFLECRMSYQWPRIWMQGIDLDVVANAMGADPSVTLTLENGGFGSLQQHHSVYDTSGPLPRMRVIGARLDFKLTVAGLEFAYDLQIDELAAVGVPGRVTGDITLAWELLILRFPRFLRHRQAVLKGLEDSNTH